jgi:transposase
VLGESLRESGQLRASCCARGGQFRPEQIPETTMFSTRGRPRQITDEQVAKLMEWQRTRKTLGQIAREIGVSRRVAAYALAIGGQYKQPSPELREVNLIKRRRKIKRLAAKGWV